MSAYMYNGGRHRDPARGQSRQWVNPNLNKAVTDKVAERIETRENKIANANTKLRAMLRAEGV